MCEPVSTGLLLGAIGASTALQVYQGEQARKAQNNAADQARANAEAAATKADQDFNKANQKRPNIAGMAADNLASAGTGTGSTLLTGPQGINPSNLLLGRNTLLGGG